MNNNMISGSLDSVINNFQTKHKEGFTTEELDKLTDLYPGINCSKFDDALIGNTCIVRDDDVLNYKHDVLTALRCGIESREINIKEWD